MLCISPCDSFLKRKSVPFNFSHLFIHPSKPRPLWWPPGPVSTSLLCLFICFASYIPHISENIQHVSFSVWLISVNIIPSETSMLSQMTRNSNDKTTKNSLFKLIFHCLCVCGVYIHTHHTHTHTHTHTHIHTPHIYIYTYTIYVYIPHLSYPFICWGTQIASVSRLL